MGARRALRWRGLLVGSGCVLVLMLGVVALVAPALRAPTAGARPTTLVVASLPFWNLAESSGVVAAHAPTFNEVSPWVYGLSPTGQIVAQAPERAPETTTAMHRLRSLSIPLIPTIANITHGHWAYPPVATMLRDPTAMNHHITDIVTLVNRENYAGIDIDYENLKATDRESFTIFVTRLGQALHAQHKILSVALFAKTTDAGDNQRNVAQNYPALGAAVDEVRLMAYDYHWESSPPGPVAPISWVRAVLAYAKTQIPPHKIVLGIPVTGYDWVDGHGQPVTWQQCFQRTTAFNTPVHYDGRSEAPWFVYTDTQRREHEVWFENADSTKAKLDAVKESAIRGVYVWMYGGADARTWDQLPHPATVAPAPSTDRAPR
jgi:spore germination protein YaaH